MRGGESDVLHRMKYSFYATVLYMLLSNPITYSFTQSIFHGSLDIVQNSVPTAVGYFFHSVLFFLLFFSVLLFPKTF
jgi:hypothetical protein